MVRVLGHVRDRFENACEEVPRSQRSQTVSARVARWEREVHGTTMFCGNGRADWSYVQGTYSMYVHREINLLRRSITMTSRWQIGPIGHRAVLPVARASNWGAGCWWSIHRCRRNVPRESSCSSNVRVSSSRIVHSIWQQQRVRIHAENMKKTTNISSNNLILTIWRSAWCFSLTRRRRTLES